ERFFVAFARRDFPEHPQIRDVARDQRKGIPERERSLPPDEREVRDRQKQAEDLNRVLIIETDRDYFSAEDGRDEVDHRPAEADEKTKAAGEVCNSEMRLRRVLPRL